MGTWLPPEIRCSQHPRGRSLCHLHLAKRHSHGLPLQKLRAHLISSSIPTVAVCTTTMVLELLGAPTTSGQHQLSRALTLHAIFLDMAARSLMHHAIVSKISSQVMHLRTHAKVVTLTLCLQTQS